jgi:hypothetical protein
MAIRRAVAEWPMLYRHGVEKAGKAYLYYALPRYIGMMVIKLFLDTANNYRVLKISENVCVNL